MVKGKFIRSDKTVFTRTSLRILPRASYCGRISRAREINRVLERKYQGGKRGKGDRILLKIGVLSGRARFIRYFSRDLSTHSLIFL